MKENKGLIFTIAIMACIILGLVVFILNNQAKQNREADNRAQQTVTVSGDEKDGNSATESSEAETSAEAGDSDEKSDDEEDKASLDKESDNKNSENDADYKDSDNKNSDDKVSDDAEDESKSDSKDSGEKRRADLNPDGTKKAVYAEVSSGDSWQDKKKYVFQYNINVHNNSKEDLEDWEVRVSGFSGADTDGIVNGWNGEFEIKGDYLYITAVDYNKNNCVLVICSDNRDYCFSIILDILPGSSTIGLITYFKKNIIIISILC